MMSTGNTAPFYISDIQVTSFTATMATFTCSLNITIPATVIAGWIYNNTYISNAWRSGTTTRIQIQNPNFDIYQCVFSDVLSGWTIRRNIRLGTCKCNLTLICIRSTIRCIYIYMLLFLVNQ